MTAYVIRPHLSQYDAGNSAITRTSGCTWTSGANGANATLGKHLTPDQVHAKVARAEEENPLTPGWTIGDLELAMHRLGVPFAKRSGSGWGALVAYHDAGYYIALQGDSDQFTYGCSGAFDGDHCIGIWPQEDANGLWLIDDPICPDHRYESSAYVQRYAQKLSKSVRFGQFLTRVPAKRSQGSVALKAGRYATYDITAGKAHLTGQLVTGGFPNAPAKTRSTIGPKGRIPFVQLTGGAHKGTILYRYAAGLTYTPE